MALLSDLIEECGRIERALDCGAALRLIDDGMEQAAALGAAEPLAGLTAIRDAVADLADLLNRAADLAGRNRSVLAEFADDGTAPSTRPSRIGPLLPPIRPLEPARRSHILDGDRTGGGHRAGTGSPGKSEFPARWSDEQLIAYVLDVARHPAHTEQQQADGRFRAHGRRDGVDIRVIVEEDGRICTAMPLGGHGVIRNPRKARR